MAEDRDDVVDAGLGLLGGLVGVMSVLLVPMRMTATRGLQAIDLAVGDSPEDIGGGVAAEAQVERAAGLVELFPDGEEVLVGRSGLVVVLCDGVADEEELRIGVGADGVDDCVVTLGPPGKIEPVRGSDGGGDL